MLIYYKSFYFNLIFLILNITSIISLFINIIILGFIIEINNFIFLFYLTLFIKNKKIFFLYFFIQVIASLF